MSNPTASLRTSPGFTLLEMLVAVAILTIMMAFLGQMLVSSSSLVLAGNKRMDVDTQARELLDRMAIDFSQIVKRPDLSYYLKDANTPQPGNDQLSFFSSVPGYATDVPSPTSLVAYRVNATTLYTERLGRGLDWNGGNGIPDSLVFLPQTIENVWPQATNMNADAYYEPIATAVFRLEYYYLLKGHAQADGTVLPAVLSDTPWDTRIPSHTSVNGLSDVAAISVVIAALDPGSRTLVNSSQLANLGGSMNDFSPSMQPGQLETQWNGAIAGSSLPKIAAAAVRVYSRTFYLSTGSP